MIRNHIAADPDIEKDDFNYAAIVQQNGVCRVNQLFGDELNVIVEQLK